MEEKIVVIRTTLANESVISRAVQFFSTKSWRSTGQSATTATFEGKPPIPWGMLTLMILGYVSCVVPGVILHFMVIKKMYGFQNIVVAVEAEGSLNEVTIRHSKTAAQLVQRFVESLPSEREPLNGE